MQTPFGTSAYDDPMEALTRLKQTTTVVSYKGNFKILSNRIKGLSESHKLSCFLSGRKDEIRLPVKMSVPKSLNDAFGLAKIQEEFFISSRKNQRSSSFEYSKPSILRPKLEIKLDSRFKFPLQRMSPTQMEERRRKGLCFNFDDKFQPGHQCKSTKIFLLEEGLYPFHGPSSNVQLLELDETKSIFPQHEIHEIKSRVGERSEVGEKGVAVITLYALFGSPSPSTMKVRGKINGYWVTILINTSSTHNFLDASVLLRLQLQLDTSRVLEVKVADGTIIKTLCSCPGVTITIQGISLS